MDLIFIAKYVKLYGSVAQTKRLYTTSYNLIRIALLKVFSLNKNNSFYHKGNPISISPNYKITGYNFTDSNLKNRCDHKFLEID